MPNERNDGGSAFPVTYEGGANNGDTPFFAEGMSLRDWFAGQAMASAWEVAMTYQPPDDSQSPEQYCAMQAYRIADAMLAERSK